MSTISLPSDLQQTVLLLLQATVAQRLLVSDHFSKNVNELFFSLSIYPSISNSYLSLGHVNLLIRLLY